MTLAYAINSFDLHQPAAGYKLLDATAWASPVTMPNLQLSVPRMHGTVPVWQVGMESSSIIFRVRITGATDTELNTRWNALVRQLGVGANRPVLLTRTRATSGSTNGRVTTAFAQLASIEQPDFSCAAGYVTTTIVFNIPSGRWAGAWTEETLTFGTQVADIAADGTMPITDAMVRVKGPINSLSVFDNVSQTGFTWSGANITTDQWLLVDMQSFTAWAKNDAGYDLNDTNVSALLRSTGLGWLALVPGLSGDTSASSITVTGGGTSGATVATLRARPAYH